ncbi:MAG: L7Ae/L30e/S12e/Gadd45 family ribosomal protein [Emergencia sp.]
MNRNKVFSYLGFAARSRNLVTGGNTCVMMMSKKKIKLLILTKDLSENTMKKMLQQCSKRNIVYRIFGSSEELSQITGKAGKGVFGITDQHFAEIILKEIDLIQSEREVFE